MRFVALLLGWSILGFSHAAGGASPVDVAANSVVELRAYARTGAVSLGSAVVVGPQRLATNCHVTRGATRIEVITSGGVTSLKVTAAHAGRDVCFIDAPALARAPASVATSARIGQKVFAAGFPAGKQLTLTEGNIVALHEYDAGHVIQISAFFDHGASGGALLDEHGQLLGLLTFKALAGGAFHFAVPADWLHGDAAHTSTSGVPFWERGMDELPYFLRAASMEAAHNWTGLMTIARDWKAREPKNAEAARALEKAQARLALTSSRR